jgi:Mrp family chromosome partitioning ATPase
MTTHPQAATGTARQKRSAQAADDLEATLSAMGVLPASTSPSRRKGGAKFMPAGTGSLSRGVRSARSHMRRGDTLLEHFRRVYLAAQPADSVDVPPSLGVTSALSGEGRTTVATGIAAVMAMDLDVPVVLVEVDLAHPGMHRILGIAPEPGISEYLRGECEVATAVRQISDRLFVLPAGNPRGDAARLIRQLTTADLRARLNTSGAILVFDLPPILDSSYGLLASSMAESLIFVVRSGQTTSAQVKDALERLDEAAVRGLVLNGAEPFLPSWLRPRR